MSSGTLYQHYKNQIVTFKKHFDQAKEKSGVEDIHQLRVDIKRLRAMLSLMEIGTNGKFSKKQHFNLFSELFKTAGILREIQVNRSLVTGMDQKIVFPYEKYLIEQQDQSLTKLNEVLNSFDQKQFEAFNLELYNSIEPLTDGQIIDQAELFIKNKLKKIDGFRKELNDDNRMHKMRMHLKDVIEISKIHDYVHPERQFRGLRHKLKILEGLVGNWHDKVVLIASMEHFVSDNDITEKKKLLALIKTIRRNSNKVKKNIASQQRKILRKNELFS